ncbi:MAG: thioredoxin [Rhodothalassiaceae bacterium]
MEPLISAGPSPADLIKEGTTQGFAQDVIEASQQTPVLVDFWAPWCAPCRQLTPALEKLVTEQRGAIKLVKINVDDHQQLAAQLRIQSLPTVMAFVGGRPVDGFQGAVPESQLRQFIQQLATQGGGSPIDAALEEADALLAAGQADQAAGLYQQILQADPNRGAAYGGLASALLALGQAEDGRALLDQVPADVHDPAIDKARAALDLADQAGDAGDVAGLAARVEADPADLQARLDLAVALAAKGRRDEAAEHLLEIIRTDRSWQDEAARKQLVKMFEAAGPTDPFTIKMRRKLSGILFA